MLVCLQMHTSLYPDFEGYKFSMAYFELFQWLTLLSMSNLYSKTCLKLAPTRGISTDYFHGNNSKCSKIDISRPDIFCQIAWQSKKRLLLKSLNILDFHSKVKAPFKKSST